MGEAVEQPGLVRLGAVLYFMGSSMLVQFTTKVRRWMGAQRGGSTVAQGGSTTTCPQPQLAAPALGHWGAALPLGVKGGGKGVLALHALPFHDQWHTRAGQFFINGCLRRLQVLAASTCLPARPLAAHSPDPLSHSCSSPAGCLHQLRVPLSLNSGPAANGLHRAGVICGGTATAVVGAGAPAGPTGHGQRDERCVRAHR